MDVELLETLSREFSSLQPHDHLPLETFTSPHACSASSHLLLQQLLVGNWCVVDSANAGRIGSSNAHRCLNNVPRQVGQITS